MEGSAAAKGYSALWSLLNVPYRVNIKRGVVIKLLRELDPNGSEIKLNFMVKSLKTQQ